LGFADFIAEICVNIKYYLEKLLLFYGTKTQSNSGKLFSIRDLNKLHKNFFFRGLTLYCTFVLSQQEFFCLLLRKNFDGMFFFLSERTGDEGSGR